MKDLEKTNYVDFPRCPDGQHVARLVGIFDLGTQEVVFEGNTKMTKRMYLQFEVYAESEDGEGYAKDQRGHFFLIGQEFTAVMSNKGKLLPFVNSWRGKPLEDADFPFRFSRMLGKCALLSVATTVNKTDPNKKYASILSVAPVPKRLMEGIPNPMLDPFFFDLDAQNWGAMSKFFDSGRLWDKIKARIAGTAEYKARTGGKTETPVSNDPADDDIPF